LTIDSRSHKSKNMRVTAAMRGMNASRDCVAIIFAWHREEHCNSYPYHLGKGQN
jgi:hypothetical protein